MTDQEIASMAQAVRSLLDERDIALRMELASMRSALEESQAEVQTLRAKVAVLPSELHASTVSTVKTIIGPLAAAIPGAVQASAERQFLKMAMERGMPTEVAPQ